MYLRKTALAGAFSLMAGNAWAGCAYENTVPVSLISNAFEAWKVVGEAMAECGNFNAEHSNEFILKQGAAFEQNPSLYQIGGVANSSIQPLLNGNLLRPLDDLVAEHGQHLRPGQLIRMDGKIMAIGMMINAQHLMYRTDLFADLGIAVPSTYEEVLAAADAIQQAGVVQYPLGGTYKADWNLGLEFVNLYLGNGGEFFGEGFQPAINNDAGIATLETMKRLTAYMDPEYLVSDVTYVIQQFQQGKIAMANLWADSAGAVNREGESQAAGLIGVAAAPNGSVRPASALWWDGLVFAKNMSDEAAEAAFRVAMEGIDREMVEANNDSAIWLIDGYVPGPLAAGAQATAEAGAVPYPASPALGLLLDKLGSGLAAYFTGEKDATTTLADVEADYLVAAREAGMVE